MFGRHDVYMPSMDPNRAIRMTGRVMVTGTMVVHTIVVEGQMDGMAVEAQDGNGHCTVHGRSNGRPPPPAHCLILHWRMELHGTVPVETLELEVTQLWSPSNK